MNLGDQRQEHLFYDDEYAALRTVIEQGKGYKATAMFLWPGMKPESAYAKLKAATKGGGDEHLKFREIIAAQNFNGRFDALYHACDETLHERPKPRVPLDEEKRLVSVIDEATRTVSKALDQLERLKAAAPPGAVRQLRTGTSE